MHMNPDCAKDTDRSSVDAGRLSLGAALLFQEATSCTPLMSAPHPS
jgi:hypothetical protein